MIYLNFSLNELDAVRRYKYPASTLSVEAILDTMDSDFKTGVSSFEITNAETVKIFYEPNEQVSSEDLRGKFLEDYCNYLELAEKYNFNLETLNAIVAAATPEQITRCKMAADTFYRRLCQFAILEDRFHPIPPTQVAKHYYGTSLPLLQTILGINSEDEVWITFDLLKIERKLEIGWIDFGEEIKTNFTMIYSNAFYTDQAFPKTSSK